MSSEDPRDREAEDRPVEMGALRRNIETTRAQLGDVVEALAAKVNVPRRVKRRAAALGRKVTAPVGRIMSRLRRDRGS